MPVPDAIWKTPAGSIVKSLVKLAGEDDRDNEFREELFEYLIACEDVAQTGTMVRKGVKMEENEEVMTELGNMCNQLQSWVASPTDDFELSERLGTVPIAKYPDYRLLQLGTVVKRCLTADPSWIQATAVLGLQEHSNSLRDDPEWRHPDFFEKAQNLRCHIKKYIEHMSAIDGPSVTIDFGDKEGDITSDPIISELPAALSYVTRCDGVLPLYQAVDDHPGIDSETQEEMDVWRLRPMVDRIDGLIETLRQYTEQVVQEQRGEGKREAASATVRSRWPTGMTRESYTAMMERYKDWRR